MTPRYTVSAESMSDLRIAFEELFGAAPAGAAGEAPAAANGANSKGQRGRKAASQAPDPAPIPAADPFGGAAPAADPFGGAAPAAGSAAPTAGSAAPTADNPFGAPQTAPAAAAEPIVNPSVEKLMSRIDEQARRVAPERVASWIAAQAGLSPGLSLADIAGLLLAGKISQDAIDRLLDGTGGR